MKIKKISYEKQRTLFGYVFTAPFIIGTLVFFAYPVIYSMLFALGSFEGNTSVDNMSFVGFANFKALFGKDINFMPDFAKAIANALINTPLIVLISIILVICLNKNIKLKGVFRVIFFLPFVLGNGLIYQTLMYSGSTSDTMVMLNGISVPPQFSDYFGEFLTEIITVLLERFTTVLWKSGLPILLFLSAIQSIPVSVYESAHCDGASEWKSFWFITLPMLTPTILVVIVYTLVDSFNDINNSVMQYYQYLAFKTYQHSYASAMAWTYFLFVILLILAVTAITRKYVFYNTEKRS
ncbi:MAG: sugar ABC transporter permease [Clostridia bacterium]|nr:sugar ABC transporter permease [Clostridia bacterium]